MGVLHGLENGDLHLQILDKLFGLELQTHHGLDCHGFMCVIVNTFVYGGEGALPNLGSDRVHTYGFRHGCGDIICQMFCAIRGHSNLLLQFAVYQDL